MDEERKKPEDVRKAEEDRIAAEREFLEKHERERRISSQRKLSTGTIGGNNSGTSSQAESESEADKRKRFRSRDSPEGKERKKKSKTTDRETSEDEEDKDQDDALKGITKLMQKMRCWFKQPTTMKMVTKPQTEKFQRYLDKLQEEVMKAREERARLETRIEERAALAAIVREEMRKVPVDEVKNRWRPSQM